MFIDFLLKVFKENKEKEAIVWRDNIYYYDYLLQRVLSWQETLEKEKIPKGSVAIIEADFSPNSVALFLALMEHECVLVPMTSAVEAQKDEFIEIAQGEVMVTISGDDEVSITNLQHNADHRYYKTLRERRHPGLILFSSGSTGKPKATVHDMTGLLKKFHVGRKSMRAITFLLYDHIGGVNTMLYTLSNAGCIITVRERTPDRVLQAIERYKVENLPTSPTFINLIILSEAYKRYDLSSLKLATYGTEPMPESTLKRFHELLPDIRLLQTYGLSEIGIMRSKSKSSDSLWVKIGGEGYETRIVDGILEVKAESTMLGYLNAPSPFTKDGWFHTGDMVKVDGEYMRILGRKSEIINVGGEKVYPAEVESIIQEVENVSEVTVYGQKNPITGQIVCAKIGLKQEEEKKAVVSRIKKHCRSQLQSYKVPVKIRLSSDKQHSMRFKKKRSGI